MTAYKLVTGPSVEPVSLAELKVHARIDSDDDDALLSTLIVASRQWSEQYTARAFVTQTWQMWVDAPCFGRALGHNSIRDVDVLDRSFAYLALHHAPLQAVRKIEIYDQNDQSAIWNACNYYVDTIHEPGRVVIRNSSVWPCPGRDINGLCITYDAGYGANPTDVPEPIRLAIKQLALHWYEHRGEEIIPSSANSEVSTRYGSVNVPLLIQALLNPYRIVTCG